MLIQPIKNIDYTFSTQSLINTISDHKYKIAGVALGALALLAIVLVTFFRKRRNENAITSDKKTSEQKGQTPNQPDPKLVLSNHKDVKDSQTKPAESSLPEHSNPTPSPNPQVKQNTSSQEKIIDKNLQQSESAEEEINKWITKSQVVAKKIFDLNKKIESKEGEIEEIKKQIHDQSPGIVWELKFAPTDKLTTKNGFEVEASEFAGPRYYYKKFEEKYEMVLKDKFDTLNPDDYKEGILVLEGSQIEKFEIVSVDNCQKKYKFTTIWQAKKDSLPYIKVSFIAPNTSLNEAKVSEFWTKRKELEKEVEQLSLEKDQNDSELQGIQKEIDSLNKKLEINL